MRKEILVTGSNGQVGEALKSISRSYPEIDFVFLDSSELDITNVEQCDRVFDKFRPDYCINLAAYTAVDKAEEESELAFAINADGVKNLALVCKKYDVVMIQISTDFVFDGKKNTPYTVLDLPNPINVYGKSKLRGEQYIKELLVHYYIVRTSWVYSDFGNNFKKTMLYLAETREEINVVNDQIGCPTHAVDLCTFLLHLVQDNCKYGLYHYSGEKVYSWYRFVLSIFDEEGINIKVNPISTEEYPTKAERPKYSVLR